MIDPWKAYATLFDWVYLRAKVATIRSVTAADGSCGVSASGSGLLHSRGGNGTNVFIFGNEIFEQRTIDLAVVPLLLEIYAVHLFGFNHRRHVGWVYLFFF